MLTEDNIYNRLYSGEQDLDVYYKAAMIGKKVKTFLNTSQLSRSAKNDILFYVIYALVAKKLHKRELTFNDLFGIDIDSIDDAAINDAINLVNNKYIEKGASGSIAKSPAFINDVDAALNL